jgi:predicted dehydrogenase
MGRTYAGCLAGQVQRAGLVSITGGSRAAGLAREYGVDAEPSLDALLNRDDVEAVILATPHSLHVPQTLQAAAAGKHVLVEKPMGRTVSECDQMIDACQAAGVTLSVNKVLRFRQAPMAAKRLVDEGAIGDVRLMLARHVHTDYLNPGKAWTFDPEEGSRWLDIGAHLTDLFRWFSGSEAITAFADYHNYTGCPPEPRTALVHYRFRNGAMAQALMSYELPEPGLPPTDTVMIIGSQGMIDLDEYGKVRLGRGDGWTLAEEQPAFDYLEGYMDPARLAAFAAQVQDFVDAITEEREPVVGGGNGRAAVEMVQAADRSAATGQVVSLPLSDSAP